MLHASPRGQLPFACAQAYGTTWQFCFANAFGGGNGGGNGGGIHCNIHSIMQVWSDWQ
jgi:hypothetical protein